MSVRELRESLHRLADPEQAEKLQRYFKTGPGEYGEGDQFLGLRMPQIRQIVRKAPVPALTDLEGLLRSPVHEERMLALLLLVRLFKKADESQKELIYRFYMDHTDRINNWDLVDLSAHHIVGPWLLNRDRSPLFALAKSDLLWDRRIAIIATFHFISRMDFDTSLKIAEIVLKDPEDLIQKAYGWMLREIGNKSRKTEEGFLKKHYKSMPRTALRYAIEKFPEPLRQAYLKGSI